MGEGRPFRVGFLDEAMLANYWTFDIHPEDNGERACPIPGVLQTQHKQPTIAEPAEGGRQSQKTSPSTFSKWTGLCPLQRAGTWSLLQHISLSAKQQALP